MALISTGHMWVCNTGKNSKFSNFLFDGKLKNKYFFYIQDRIISSKWSVFVWRWSFRSGRCSTMRCRSRRYSGSRLLIKCQTKQKSMSVFFSGNRPAICSSFIHSLTCLLCVRVAACVCACACVYMCKHSFTTATCCWPSVQRHWCCCPKPTVVCQMA